MQVIDLHIYLKVTLPQVFFKHFASKYQLPGFYMIVTLVENALKITKESKELITYILAEWEI